MKGRPKSEPDLCRPHTASRRVPALDSDSRGCAIAYMTCDHLDLHLNMMSIHARCRMQLTLINITIITQTDEIPEHSGYKIQAPNSHAVCGTYRNRLHRSFRNSLLELPINRPKHSNFESKGCYRLPSGLEHSHFGYFTLSTGW